MDSQRVLKLIAAERGLEAAERESRLTCLARSAGLQAPEVYGLLRIDGRCGIILQRLYGQTLYDMVRSRPFSLLARIHDLADLHAAVHDKSGRGLPSQRELLENSVQAAHLREDLKKAALAVLHRLPDGDVFCHGDLNLSNVIQSRERLVCVDWARASRGNPLADVARTAVMLRTLQWGKPPRTRPWRWLFLVGRALAWRTYLRRYRRLRRFCPDEFSRWELVAASALLREPRTVEFMGREVQAIVEERFRQLRVARIRRP